MKAMTANTRRRRTCALLLTLACAAPVQAGVSFEEGVAHRPDGSRLLYREQHWVRREAQDIVERLVLYRCADGTAFARKRIDYRPSAVAPAFRFEDRRSGYVEGLHWGKAPEVFVRAGDAVPEKRARLSVERLVVDAGFDEFIRRHWSALVSGQAVPLSFAIPARQQSFGFSLRRMGTARTAGEEAWVFRLSLRGWLSLLAPHVDVHYGQHSRRLLRFQGLSNLRDDAGRRPLDARIEFPRPPQPSDEAQWRAAQALPLSSCRTES